MYQASFASTERSKSFFAQKRELHYAMCLADAVLRKHTPARREGRDPTIGRSLAPEGVINALFEKKTIWNLPLPSAGLSFTHTNKW